VNSPERRRSSVRWTSKVVDAFDDGDVAGALLEGAVWDLAWWSPDVRPGAYAVLRAGTQYYLVADRAKEVFAAVKKSGRRALTRDVEHHPWFATPLRRGQMNRDPELGPRDDTNYGWFVESAAPAKLGVPGTAGAAWTAYVLAYRTLGSNDLVTFVPGIGITAFTFVHHGTLAEAYVHLAAFRRGGGR